MNKVLSLQKESISKDVQLKAKSSGSIQCKTSSNASWFLC
ncbi:class III lanthipeptide [Viridibacillus sp. FSL E2-0187]